MNRILLFAVTGIATLFCSQSIWAEEREYTDTQKVVYTYDTDGTTAKVKAGSLSEEGCGSPDAFGDLIISEKITIDNKSYTVTEIGYYAFNRNEMITSVVIPDCVQEIGIAAFQFCYRLKKVTMPSNLTAIKKWTFRISGLEEFSIPSSVSIIEDAAFEGCNMEHLYIPASVSSIGVEAFRDCSNVKSVTVDAANTVFDSRDNCNAIIRTNDNELISGFPITKIPNSVEAIGNCAFMECHGLTNITIPEGVKRLDRMAFYACWDLKEILLPNTLKEIGEGVFAYCANMTSLTIPNSVTSLESGSLRYSGLTEFVFPEGISSIEHEILGWCDKLKKVVIPENISEIKYRAFWDCPNLQIVICKKKVPIELGRPWETDNVFELEDSSFTNATLYVPANSIESYKGADVWKNFKSIKSLEEYISDEQLALGIGDVETLSDGTFNVPIALTNNITITAFQMDIKADNGATVEGVTLSDRASADHSVSTKKLDDGTLRVIVYSNTSQPFAGDNGTLLNIQVSIQSGNEHFISLTNIEMTGTDGTEYDLSDFSNKFVSLLIGDANCDGNVTITDVTAIINHILGDTPSPFNTNAADVNRNGKVSVSDIVLLINNYILTANSNVSNRSFAIEDDMNAVLTLANPKVIDNHSVNISMVMNNQEQDITAFQCDVLLPDDIRLADNGLILNSNRSTGSHVIVSKMISDNVLRIVCYSMQNESFAGMADAVLNVTLETEQLQEGKEYSIGLRNIELSTTQAESVLSKNVSLSFTADKGIDAIENIKAKANKDTRIYNMKGQSIPNGTLQRGIYINAGRKYLK